MTQGRHEYQKCALRAASCGQPLGLPNLAAFKIGVPDGRKFEPAF